MLHYTSSRFHDVKFGIVPWSIPVCTKRIYNCTYKSSSIKSYSNVRPTQSNAQVEVETTEDTGSAHLQLPKKPNAVYIKRNIDGKQLSYPDDNVVIVGDVSADSSISAGGDVVVLGRLQGSVHAGVKGDTSAQLIALESCNPGSIRVASAQVTNESHNSSGPITAKVDEEGNLKVERSIPGMPLASSIPAVADWLGALVGLLGLALVVAPASVSGLAHATTSELGESILQTCVYAYMLLRGAGQLAEGSELLLEVLDPGIIGGVLLPLLGAVPDILIVLTSGLGVDQANAQRDLGVGVGALAGSTILLLSVAWGGSVLLGRCDLDEQGRQIDRQLTRGWDLSNTGVSVDGVVSSGVTIMAVSALLFGIVQIPAFLGDTQDPQAALAGCIVCLVCGTAYLGYSVLAPELQRRRIADARRRRFRAYALRALELASRRQKLTPMSWGQNRGYPAFPRFPARDVGPVGNDAGAPARLASLLQAEGVVNKLAVDLIFDEFDKDHNGIMDARELQGLLRGLELAGLMRLPKSDEGQVLDFWVRELKPQTLEQGSVGITRDDFYSTVSRWVSELSTDPTPRASRLLERLRANLRDSKLSGAMRLSGTDVYELEETARELGNESEEEAEGDLEVDGEMGEGEGEGEKPISRNRILLEASLRLGAGLSLCAIFSEPLVESLVHASEVSHVPSFFIAFILTPLASNSTEVISSLRFATRQRSKNISLTFSQIYGAVLMSNTIVLGIFLLVVYIQKLQWVYSSEVTVIFGATAAFTLIAGGRKSIPAWLAVPALLLYPLSIGAVWWLDTTLGWQ